MDFQHSASFLRREKYIRYAGILLTLSPLGNFFWSSALSGIYHWWDPRVLLVILRGIPPILWFLWGSAFFVGLTMLKGKRTSWILTLCVLGLNVVFGIATFKKDIAQGWLQPTLSLAVNIGLFVMIYTQEFHQRLERKLWQARMNRPFAMTVHPIVSIHFEGLGPWARITEIKNTGFRVTSVSESAPKAIEYRTVEIALAQDLVLRARFSARIGSDYVFRFVQMNPALLAKLQRWAYRVGSPIASSDYSSSGPTSLAA